MPRIVVGNCGGTVALTQARSVLAELNETWPDISIVQRTVQAQGQARAHPAAELLDALSANRISIAVQRLDTLPVRLPDGLVLAAVGRRLEARTALISGYGSLDALPERARVGVVSAHDGAFLRYLRPNLSAQRLDAATEDFLVQVLHGDLDAALAPAADLISGGWRERIGALLEPQLMPPPAGQGALGFVVRDDDDLAGELAYTLRHRPSFDRARAERAFVATLTGAVPAETAVGAFAAISDDGTLNLLGAVAGAGGDLSIQAEVADEAGEAEELGRELAQDVLAQLSSRS
jgi:hydroxymethylbilane synthase